MKNNLLMGLPIEKKFSSSIKNVSFLNLYSILMISKSDISDSEVEKISFFLDGWLLCKVAEIIFGDRFDRVSFDYTSIAGNIFDAVNINKKKIVFVGAEQDVIERFNIFFRENYPDAQLVCGRNGFFRNKEEKIDFCNFIIDNDVDYVVIGMGAVHQEKFIIDLINCGYRGFSYTCGGFIDQTVFAGKKYYPKWIDHFNLRWLYRIFMEPKRLIPRYAYYYPIGLFKCFFYGRKRPK